MDDEFPGSMLLPCLLLSSAVLLLLLSVWDWGADKEREERRLRREKILKNTKDEAIKQVHTATQETLTSFPLRLRNPSSALESRGMKKPRAWGGLPCPWMPVWFEPVYNR